MRGPVEELRSQAGPIGVGYLAARLRPAVEMGELHGEHRGLDRVEPAVGAAGVVVVPRATVVAHPPQLRGELVVVGGDRAGVAERAEVLARVEAEASGEADRACGAIAVARAVGLRCVLDDGEIVLAGEAEDRLRVAEPAVEVDGDDRPGARSEQGGAALEVDQAGVAGRRRRTAGSPPRSRQPLQSRRRCWQVSGPRRLARYPSRAGPARSRRCRWRRRLPAARLRRPRTPARTPRPLRRRRSAGGGRRATPPPRSRR